MSAPVKSIPRDEQETVISFMRDDHLVSVWTSNRTHVDRLRRMATAEPTRSYVTEVSGGETWGDFRVNIENFKLFSAIRKPRIMSDEQRVAAANRLAAYREG